MTPKDHEKACEPLIAELQEHLAQATRQLMAMRAAMNSGNYATANIDAQRINHLVSVIESSARFLRGHTFEAALKARGESNG